jgi:hypothetical protein
MTMTISPAERVLLDHQMPDPVRSAARRALARAHRRQEVADALITALFCVRFDAVILVEDVPVVDCAESTLSLSEATAGLNAHDSAVVAGFVAEIEGVLAANVRRMQS